MSKHSAVQKKMAPASPPVVTGPGLRKFMYLTAAVTGAAVMIVEILGAKMLAPFLGTSHFVWTAQIAVTLVALAAGYWLGGLLVKRALVLRKLYVAILAAGLYLCLSIWAIEPIAYGCLNFRLAAGSLIAATFLFFPPLALLAMTAPFLIASLTSSVSSVGQNVGQLTAVSTMGSFIGTMLIGYVLIPFLPNSMIMYLTAGVLIILAATYLLTWERRQGALVTVFFLSGGLIGFFGVNAQLRDHFASMEQIYRGNSNFGELQVLQSTNGLRRYYLNDNLVQNSYDPLKKKSAAMFTYMLHGLAKAYTPNVDRVLCIGMGVGIVPMQFAREGVKVDVVEINPAVVRVATNHFNCDPSLFTLTLGDGRQFLNRATRVYDAVVLDAFLGDSSPSHLMSREAFLAVRRLLSPNGTLVINCFGSVQGGDDMFAKCLGRTLRAVFPSVRIHQAYLGGNVFFVASPRQELSFVHSIDLNTVHEDVRDAVRAAFEGVSDVNMRKGIVLTDDYNPLDYYDAANRERIRRQLAQNVKAM